MAVLDTTIVDSDPNINIDLIVLESVIIDAGDVVDTPPITYIMRGYDDGASWVYWETTTPAIIPSTVTSALVGSLINPQILTSK